MFPYTFAAESYVPTVLSIFDVSWIHGKAV